jgi:hypothetical protein
MLRATLVLISALCAGYGSAETLSSGMKWPPPQQRNISAPNINGAVLFTKSAENVTIGPVVIEDAFRAIETAQGVTLRNLHVTGLSGRNLQRDGMRLRHVTDAVISDFDLQMRAQPQTGRDLPEGIALYAGSNIVVRDGLVSGFRMADENDPKTGKPRYQNGDGVSSETGVNGLLIERVVSRNNSDGGFDLKGRNIRLVDLTAEDNGKGFRFWEQVAATKLTSVNNKVAIHLMKGATATIDRLDASSAGQGIVILSEGVGTLTIRACDLTKMAAGSVLVKRNDPGAVINLGDSCKLPSPRR